MTLNEKKLTIALLKEKLQNLSGKKVIFEDLKVNEAFVDDSGNYFPDELDQNISGETTIRDSIDARVKAFGKELGLDTWMITDYQEMAKETDPIFYHEMSDEALIADMKEYKKFQNAHNGTRSDGEQGSDDGSNRQFPFDDFDEFS
jgi:hypothetical protein